MRYGVTSAAVCLFLTGCTLLPEQNAPVITRFRLNYPPPSPSTVTTPGTLAVMPFRVDATYARSSIVFTDGTRAGYYLNDQWIAPPEQLLTDAFQRDLSRWSFFEAVTQGGMLLRPAYTLGGTVTAFGEERRETNAMARASVTITLTARSRRGGDRVLLQDGYTARVPCPTNDPSSLVTSLSKAVRAISREVRDDIAKIVRAQCAETNASARSRAALPGAHHNM